MRAAVLAVLIVALASCASGSAGSLSPAGSAESPLPSGGLTRDHAVALATTQAGSTTPVHLQSAVTGPLKQFSPNASSGDSSPDELVWAITFDGTFVHPCPAPPAICQPAHLETVLLDYFTGEVLLSTLQT